MYVKSFPVDPEKFEKLAHKGGVTKAMISKEIGRSDSYIKTSIARGILQSTAAQLIEAKYGIKPDDYAPDPEPVQVSQTRCSWPLMVPPLGSKPTVRQLGQPPTPALMNLALSVTSLRAKKVLSSISSSIVTKFIV